MTSQQHSINYLINGSAETYLSPQDRGLAYGDGVFRTFKAINGEPVNWILHYHKLEQDCARLGIACPASTLLLSDINKLEPTGSAIIKVIITRGEGHRGYAVSAKNDPTRIVMASTVPEYPETNYSNGVKAYLCETMLSHQPLLAGIKHLNRLENVLARREWSDASFSEGIMLDTKGRVIEGVSSNIFARYGKDVVTPDLSSCGVAGVTRQQILELLPTLGFRPKVANITLAKLMQADEVLICNSLIGVWQIVSFNDRAWVPQALATQLRKKL